MHTVLRVLVVYLVLMVLFRVMGKRTLAQITTFDFVVLLIISETTQQAMIGNDFSITGAAVAITTLLMMELGLSMLKERLPFLDRWMESLPLVIVEQGVPMRERMDKARVDEHDVLEAARQTQGLERMDQIKYAVLERSGKISIIPRGRAEG